MPTNLGSVPPAFRPVYRILVVDDTPSIHEDFGKIFAPDPRATGASAAEQAVFGDTPAAPTTPRFELESALQGEDALRRVVAARSEGRPFAVAFVDMRMPPGWDGIETIRHLWLVDSGLQIVICTAYSDQSWTGITRQLGVRDNLIVLKKPFDNIEVLQLAHALSAKWTLAQQVSLRLNNLDAAARLNSVALEQAERRFSAAFHHSPLAFAVVSVPAGEVWEINPAFTRLTGAVIGTVEGRPLAEMPCWGDRSVLPKLLATVASGQLAQEMDLTVQAPDRTQRTVRVSVAAFQEGARTSAFVNFRDETERSRLERELRQAHKMNAIGELAAGVAHDFNNLLTVIQGYSTTLLADAVPLSPLHADLQQIVEATHRAAALTSKLLIFSRRQPTHRETVDPAEILRPMQALLNRVIGANVDLQWSLPPSGPAILADRVNLEQVVMNLVVNARDALAGPGRINVRLDTVTLDAAATAHHPDARPGDFVRLTVEDNGCGMSPQVQSRVFEPFFTTKAPGRGTGLGLSTVYGIVRQHEGWIELQSAVGQGSTFTLHFPAQAMAPRAAPPPVPAPVAAEAGRRIRVLLAEDEPAVNALLSTILPRHGFDITSCVDGPTALEAWRRAEGAFDLLLTDIVMPNGMAGTELARILRRTRPSLRVVFATGYSAEFEHAFAFGDAGPPPRLIRKPFELDVLLRTLREEVTGDDLPRP